MHFRPFTIDCLNRANAFVHTMFHGTSQSYIPWLGVYVLLHLFPLLELAFAPITWMTLSNCIVHGGYCSWFAKGMESHRPFFLNFIIIAPLFLPQPDFPLEMKWKSNWFSFLLLSSLFFVPERKIAWSRRVALLPPIWSHREEKQ